MLIGHERQIAYLERVRKNGKLAHAYLFHGPEHIGKHKVALALAQAFYCEHGDKILSVCHLGGLEKAKKLCPDCSRIARSVHPNVIVLGSDQSQASKKSVPDKSFAISIDDVRNIRKQLTIMAAAGRWRVFIFDGAERLTREAANALLKTLEEPHPGTLFLLTTSQPDAIPPTIASRSATLNFHLVPDAILASSAKQYASDPELIQEAVRHATGRPGRLISFLTDPKERQRVAQRAKQISLLLSGDTLDALAISAAVWQDPAETRRLTEDVILSLRARLLQYFSSYGKIISITDSLKRIESVRHMMDRTAINRRLAMEVLLTEAQKTNESQNLSRYSHTWNHTSFRHSDGAWHRRLWE